jgi:hypothetical protein
MLAPLFCSAHGTEFILARLDLTTPGQVTITLAADYSANPMIQSEQEARSLLPDCLHLRQQPGERAVPLSTLGTVIFEKRDAPDPDAPIPPDPLAEDQKHDILTATVQWKTDATALRFEVPRTSQHDVLLWRKNPATQQTGPQWQLLLVGDKSSDIPLPPRPTSSHPWLYLALCAALLLLLTVSVSKRRSRTP